MKWLPWKEDVGAKSPGGVDIIVHARGWRCSTCGLKHTASEERPGMPEGGCWQCGERDEERGIEATPTGPTGREVLGRIETDPKKLGGSGGQDSHP